MKYFVLQKKIGPGSPPHLNGLLHSSALENGANIPPDYDWYWVDQGAQLQDLPSELFFYTKDPQYLFDIRSGNSPGEYFISNEMLRVLAPHLAGECQTVPLTLVSNHKAIKGSKQYSYIRLAPTCFLPGAVLDDSVLRAERRRSGELKRVLGLAMRGESLPAVFSIMHLLINRLLFVSSAVKEQCLALNPVGVEFVPSEAMDTLDRI